jgi:hypothetical protein
LRHTLLRYSASGVQYLPEGADAGVPTPSGLRVQVALIASTLAIAAAGFAACFQLTSHAANPARMMALAAVGLAAVIIVLLAQTAWLTSALTAGPLRCRVAALQRKSWGAVFQRQLNPDAAGRARPRAPSAAPTAA